MPKSLTTIWNDPEYEDRFNKFNTFLLDDRLGNLCHEVNQENGILVQAFAPFGETKVREKTTCCLLEKAIKDPMFGILNKIISSILSDIDGCGDEDIEGAFDKESVFVSKCLKRKNLDKYFKKYPNCSLITIGNVANAASIHKGGKTKRKIKKTKIKTKKTKRRAKKSKRKAKRFRKIRNKSRRLRK